MHPGSRLYARVWRPEDPRSSLRGNCGSSLLQHSGLNFHVVPGDNSEGCNGVSTIGSSGGGGGGGSCGLWNILQTYLLTYIVNIFLFELITVIRLWNNSSQKETEVYKIVRFNL